MKNDDDKYENLRMTGTDPPVPNVPPSTENDFKFTKFTFIKLLLIAIGIFLLAFNTISGVFLPHGEVICLVDNVFELTGNLNNYFSQNVSSRHSLLIISSFCVDLCVFLSGIYWALYSKTYRLLVVLLTFYGIRMGVHIIIYRF